MNVLFVNNFRGRGGGEEFLRDLLPGLAQKGVNVGLVCRPGTALSAMFENTSINVYAIERSGSGAYTSAFQIAKIIRSEGYRIVNIQRGHDIIQSWAASLLSGRTPVLIYTPQVSEFNRSRILLSRMDHIVTISRHIRDNLATCCPKISSRIRIIYYGIDLSMFNVVHYGKAAIRKRFGLNPDTRIIGTVGDLWKNQIEFLDSLRDIRKEFPDTRYALVAAESGIGQIREFKERAEELGLSDAIVWVGRLSKEDMRSFYTDIDIAVSTHRNEGFGIWVLEALAVGAPVIAFNAGGIRDALEACPAGVLVDGGAREMAAQVIRVMRNDAMRKQMSEAGPRWVAEKFSRERMVEDYFRFFKTVGRKKQ